MEANAMRPMQSMQPMQNKPQAYKEAAKNYQAVYPEIYYKVQPYIMMVCDHMDYHSIMPDLDMVQEMSDHIYDDVCKMYPDIAAYAKKQDMDPPDDPPGDPPPFMFDRDRDRDRDDRDYRDRRFRRRGLFNDFIDTLLLAELFRRRRRY